MDRIYAQNIGEQRKRDEAELDLARANYVRTDNTASLAKSQAWSEAIAGIVDVRNSVYAGLYSALQTQAGGNGNPSPTHWSHLSEQQRIDTNHAVSVLAKEHYAVLESLRGE